MKRRLIGVALVASAAVGLGPLPASGSVGTPVPAGTAARVAAAKPATYIAIMDAEPAIAYEGDEAGLAATAPTEGDALSRADDAVQRYVERLTAEQDAALASVGASATDKLTSYAYAANGFAATLTGAQADALSQRPGVSFVVPDQIRTIQTDGTPDFLGLTAEDGPWSSGLTGEDVVIGVIDTGIWPEHPSFVDDGSYPALSAEAFSGTGCDFGNGGFNPDDAAFTCNNKLLAAKSYGTVFHGDTGVGLAPGSFLSARDEDGHGTHTSSTAAGNGAVSSTLLGVDRGVVSGIAPRARLSIYKACWTIAPGEGGCSNGDLVKAIDDAVADGVDVINYSIGSELASLSPDAISFLFANNAGVFVAASAGNSGPGESTIGSPAVSPWLTSVAASTQRRDFRGTVTLGDGQTFEGVTVTAGIDSAPLVDAADLGNPLCRADLGFPAGSAAGRMVLCERGGNARVEKSFAVQQSGGVAMLLFNPALNTINTDNHYIPSLHVDEVAGAAARAYIQSAGAGATASMSGGQKVDAQPNVVAAFSSRGPNLQSGDIITPDVTAPGVNILAGNTPAALLGSPGELFQAISGTSMSSPHVAGVYALVKQAHPDWSPAAAKSALMTTARQDVVEEDGVTPADPFDMGAGHVRPGGNARTKGTLFNPGLVYDAGLNDYLGYVCDVAPDAISQATCERLEAEGYATSAENLNLASIGVADVTGVATITRTITNVATKTMTWSADVDVPDGFTAAVTPDQIRLGPGESASFEVTFTRTTAEFGAWRFGSLTWTARGFAARAPIALQAKEIAFPAEVSGTDAAATLDVPVTFGYDGAYTADAHGLVAANLTPGTVVDDPDNDIGGALETGIGITSHDITVPDGTALTRISLFDAEMAGAHDLDLYVFDSDDVLVGVSSSGTSEEQVDLVLPAGGVYRVVVHGWQTEAAAPADYTLFDWQVPIDDGAGSLTITASPSTATNGASGVVSIAWAGLTGGQRHLGAVSHSGLNGLVGFTVVNVSPPA